MQKAPRGQQRRLVRLPGHVILWSLFASGGFDSETVSVSNAAVYSTSALSQPLVLSGCI